MIRLDVAIVAGGCVALGVGLAALVVGLPPVAGDLAGLVASRVGDSGVTHPVTAVLLNFRAYDTLLEVAVLMIAALAARALPAEQAEQAEQADRRPGSPVLEALARVALPLAILVAVHLLLVGASRPGGAFHAAAVLTGAGVLLRLAHGLPAQAIAGERRASRLLVAGVAVFVAVGAGAAGVTGHFLGYPPAWAGELILLVESVLAVSIAFALWALFP